MPDSGDAERDGLPSATIPSRNTEWETPFSPVAPVNADIDATREVVLYSARRRKVAIAVTAVGLLPVVIYTALIVVASIQIGSSPLRPQLTLHYFGLLLLTAFCGTGVFAAWKWANVPLAADEPPR